MPARAAESPAAATTFSGELCRGLGEGAGFVALDWVRVGMRRALGFEPWPGTLNLRMGGEAWRHWRSGLAQRPGIALPPAPGFCAAKCFRVRLNDRVEAAAVFPEVDGYPDDKLELVAPVALRAALGLHDGDAVQVQILP